MPVQGVMGAIRDQNLQNLIPQRTVSLGHKQATWLLHGGPFPVLSRDLSGKVGTTIPLLLNNNKNAFAPAFGFSLTVSLCLKHIF